MHRRLRKAILCATASLAVALPACKKNETPKSQAQQPSSAQPNPGAQAQAEPSPASTVSAPPGMVKCDFEWINARSTPTLWNEVSSAFQKELLPEKQSTESNSDSYAVKKITKMARCGDAVFVALEMVSGKKEDKDWDRITALYNFMLSTKEKTEITAKWTFWVAKFHPLARFDDGPPDIIFESYSCTECEPLVILNAVRVDPSEGKWRLREWSNGDEGIAIADAAVDVDGSVQEYQTMSGIADFDDKGHDQVALWTHYRDTDEKEPTKLLPAVTKLSLFSYKDSRPSETEIKDPAEISKIMRRLCSLNVKEPECKKTFTP
jgi:hypothetical protein